MCSLLSEHQPIMSTGFSQPNKRRRIEPRVTLFGPSFSHTVSRIVENRKAAAGLGERGVSDGENARQQLQAQRSLTDYFGWGVSTESEAQLAEILEGVMGDVSGKDNSENGRIIGEKERTEVENERQCDNELEIGRDIPDQRRRHDELEREKQQQYGTAQSVRENTGKDRNKDAAKGDSDEKGRDQHKDVIYSWLKNGENRQLPLSEEVLGQGGSRSEGDGGHVDNSNHGDNTQKLSEPVEDLYMMVKRLSRQERKERKERKGKWKMERRRAGMRDNGGQNGRYREAVSELFGRQAKKRQRSNSADTRNPQCKKARWHLATPEESSLDDSSSNQESPTQQDIAQPALQQMQSPRPSPKFGPYHITPATSDAYVDLLNRTIQDCVSHLIYSHSEETPLEPSYILGSYWASDEKHQFFDHLATRGRHDLPGIAKGVGTKSIVEVRAYLKALEEGLRDIRTHARRLGISGGFSTIADDDGFRKPGGEGALVSFEDIPAAVEISGELDTLLQKHAEYLEKEVLETEVWLEIKKWGEKWKYGLSAKTGEMEDAGEFDGNTATHKGIELIHMKNVLELSNRLFMNPIPPRNNNQISEINGDNGMPAIRFTCVTDLQNLVVSLTQKLVHASIFIAKNRIQSSLVGKTLAPTVRAADVKVAARVMGLGGKRDFWVKWPRRAGVQVFDKWRLMEPEEVERQLRLGKSKRKIVVKETQEEGGNDDEEMGGITEGEEMHVDGDGDREMGEIPLPPSSPGAFLGEDMEGLNSDVSVDEEHVLEEEMHNRADLFDAIESAKAELELWEQLLPRGVSPPRYLIQRLRDKAQPIDSTTSHLLYPPRTDCGETSSPGLTSTSTFTSSSGSDSDSRSYSDELMSTFASDSSTSGSSTTPDTTPVPTTPTVGQTQRAKRRQRRLQDWDEDWVDNYPYYAAWTSRFKMDSVRPGDHDCTGGECSGDDDEVIDNVKIIRSKGKNRQGGGKGTSATECDALSPAPPKRPRGRPRGRKLTQPCRPIGRPKLTEQQLLERQEAKWIRRWGGMMPGGVKDFLGKSGDGDHVMDGVPLADRRRAGSLGVSSAGVVSTVVAVAQAEMGVDGQMEEKGEEGEEGDDEGESNEEEGEEEDEEDIRWGSQEE